MKRTREFSAHCKHCGKARLFQRKRDTPPMTCAEYIGMGFLCVITLGLGLLVAVPYAMWRGYASEQLGKARCYTCGNTK